MCQAFYQMLLLIISDAHINLLLFSNFSSEKSEAQRFK